MSVDSVIELRGLEKSFKGHLGIGTHPAVNGLDLEVRRGEIFGLLGPNGAGKTTTLKMLVGLLRPDRGEVRILGRPPSDPAARARIGFLPENPYFYDYLTAREFLHFYGRLQGMRMPGRAERVDATLRRVGLGNRGDVALRKFSKGMVQRIGLAQSILHDPDLVILDEPMSGLDPAGRRDVRDLILAQREAGKTVFFSSHILQDAEMICDRVAILVEGRLRYAGSLDQVAGRRTLWIEAAVVGELPAPWHDDVLASHGDRSLVKVPDIESLARLLNDVSAGGGRVASIWPRTETLEDLFLREVGASSSEETRS
jgi:ABC-2 type transport system ATP-binding protein